MGIWWKKYDIRVCCNKYDKHSIDIDLHFEIWRVNNVWKYYVNTVNNNVLL